jgi:glycosyltransferase involved in cell wall biosynthesis
MEITSFEIPCIATDVGGTGEILANGSGGFLMDADFNCKELADYIYKFATMDDIEYQQFRKNARHDWIQNYSAETNYDRFCRSITRI